MKNFVVVTEIYFQGIKVSRSKCEKNDLFPSERNQLIKTLFLQEQAKGELRRLDIYTKIEAILRDRFNINFSERSVLRIITEPPIEITAKEYE